MRGARAYGVDVSETGTVVGGESSQAVAWVGGKIVDLGEGIATAISPNGNFIVGQSLVSDGHGDSLGEPALFGKTIVPIDSGGNGGGFAYDVNDSGVIIYNGGAGGGYYSGGKGHAIGTVSTTAYAINNENIIVGGNGTQAMCYRDISKKQLMTYPSLAGTTNDEGIAENNYGLFVGEAFGSTTGARAVLWENGQPIDLNSLIPAGSGVTLTVGRSINDKGEIVALGTVDNFGTTHAFLLAPNLASLSSKGTLTITGTSAADVVGVAIKGKKINVGINDAGQSFLKSKVKRISVSLFGGADRLSFGLAVPPATISGGGGNDTFFIRDGVGDVLSGGAGNDRAQIDKGDRHTSIETLLA